MKARRGNIDFPRQTDMSKSAVSRINEFQNQKIQPVYVWYEPQIESVYVEFAKYFSHESMPLKQSFCGLSISC